MIWIYNETDSRLISGKSKFINFLKWTTIIRLGDYTHKILDKFPSLENSQNSKV